MAGPFRRIAHLSPEAQAQIKSSVLIHSLNDVVLELIKNSLDANAQKIDIGLDFSKGYCSILDDGDGIPGEEFVEESGLAQLYSEYIAQITDSANCSDTSKSLGSPSYGRYGRFLASLSSMCLLSITSRHISNSSTSSVLIRDGRRISITRESIDDELVYQHGTKVVVYNLFGSLPVRVKHRLAISGDESKLENEFLALQRSMVGLVLASPRQFSFNICYCSHRYTHKANVLEDKTTSDLRRVTSTLFQAGLVESSDINNWRKLSIASTDLSILAFINVNLAPSKNIQFISLNCAPLMSDFSKPLCKRMNAMLGASSTRTNERIRPRNGTVFENMAGEFGSNKEMNKWPMFCIQIKSKSHKSYIEQSTYVYNDRLTQSICHLLEALVDEFLHSYGFETLHQMTTEMKQSSDTLSALTNPSFENWSRIKSGHGKPIDLLYGLPFTLQSSSVPTVTSIGESSDSIQLKNHRTDDIFELDPKTGNHLSMKSHATPFRYCTRQKSRDLLKVFNSHFLSPYAEPALGSITSGCNTYRNKHGLAGWTCTVRGNNHTYVNAPVSVADLQITKNDLMAAKVLSQVDDKFILASVVTDYTTLILIDQHAADERIKVEELFRNLCNTRPVVLSTPIAFELKPQEARRFAQSQLYFKTWDICYEVSFNEIRISIVPELISERCRLEPNLLIDLLRKEIWQDRSSLTGSQSGHWLPKISACPQGITNMLISRACRSAIMFNDRLTLQQCQDLVRQLGRCLFPFQCAHGRPSLTTLARFRHVDKMEEKDSTFGEGWKAWTDEESDWP